MLRFPIVLGFRPAQYSPDGLSVAAALGPFLWRSRRVMTVRRLKARVFRSASASCSSRAPQNEPKPMKFVERSNLSDPDAAARKLVQIANAVEAVRDGRIFIELITGTFLFL